VAIANPLEPEKVFGWVVTLVAQRGLVKGERIGVDGSTMEANAALRTIASGAATATATERRWRGRAASKHQRLRNLARFDCKRKGKTLSNAD
jgi:hypothetical protein